VHNVGDAGQTETHIYSWPLVIHPSPFIVEIAIAKWNTYESSGSNQVPEEVIHAGGETLWSENHKLIHSILNKKQLPNQWKESIIFCILQILEKKWEYDETVHQLFIDFLKEYNSVRREVLYNILKEFGVPMRVVRLIEMCLNETYNKIHIGNHLLDNFPIQNGIERGDALLPLISALL
jgi:hypothetical protein